LFFRSAVDDAQTLLPFENKVKCMTNSCRESWRSYASSFSKRKSQTVRRKKVPARSLHIAFAEICAFLNVGEIMVPEEGVEPTRGVIPGRF
jgi:hypothetical protein